MSQYQLQKLLADLSGDEWIGWYNKQVLIARSLANGLGRRAGLGQTASQMPQPEEIVSETFGRMMDEQDKRYIFDGSGSFDAFFARCLRTTMNSLRAAERGEVAGAQKVNPKLDLYKAPLPLVDEIVSGIHDRLVDRQVEDILAAAIANTRMSGSVRTYAGRLSMYAEGKYTTAEIAEDLGVKPGTVDTFRKRIRRVLTDPEDEPKT